MRLWLARGVLLAVVVATIGCDQASKHFATRHLMGAGHPPRPGTTSASAGTAAR